MKRNIYLEDLPLDEARSRFAAALQAAALWQPLGPEIIPLTQALGRVTAEPVWARISAPHMPCVPATPTEPPRPVHSS